MDEAPSRRLPRRSTLLPFDLFRQSLIESDTRLPAELARKFRGVRRGDALIAGPSRLAPHHGVAADQAFELAEDFPDVGRLAAADVISLAGRRFQRRHRRRYTIADVGVAARLQPVAVNDDRLAGQHPFDEAIIAHVRPLSRS